MKKTICLLVVLFLALAPMSAFAYGGPDGKGGEKSNCCLTDKFFKKMKMIFLNQDELGITDAQMEQIKSLKYDTKKYLALQDGKIEAAKVDIKSQLWKKTPDLAAINAAIDNVTTLQNEKMKTLAKSYVDMKNIITDEQKDKMKKIWLEKKKDMKKQCPMRGMK